MNHYVHHKRKDGLPSLREASPYNKKLIDYANDHAKYCLDASSIDTELYNKYGVKRGLRDLDGQGVLAGLTTISSIKAFDQKDGERVPCEGELRYRGYDIIKLVEGAASERRFGFEETAYLLLFGSLPSSRELSNFKNILAVSSSLPKNFTRDVIMKAPSYDMMNSLARSVLTLASYDKDLTDPSIENVLRQCLFLISVLPRLAVYGYHAYNHYERGESLYIHNPQRNLSAAQNILRMLRPDMRFSDLEAHVLDLSLILHMEHGGGNNSTFTTHIVSSAGSDTYSVMAAALSSLKGPRHGGANIKVVQMMDDIKRHVRDVSDEEKLSRYLLRLLRGEAFDKKGLIYGMGHAVYSLSDPRAKVFKRFVELLAEEKGLSDDFALYSSVERLAPKIIAEERKIYKGVSPNVDFYSGFVYNMMGIPLELYTPIFAMARIVGWSAHRLEEIINAGKIIRPNYMSVTDDREYTPINKRGARAAHGVVLNKDR
ncbi:MAG: citrate/2-methylcitrate synthase [Clostridia bacterium]|nr:citrate/2-methylcitrate synthase [Clostridia bacterium]